MRSEHAGALARLGYFWQRLAVFLRIAFLHPNGLRSAQGRTLIWGKVRRALLGLCPPLARHLQKRYGLSGGCNNCGASCNLLFQCPHWDPNTKLCSIYPHRPNVCRLFPITPADLRERDLVAPQHPCGYDFAAPRNPRRPVS